MFHSNCAGVEEDQDNDEPEPGRCFTNASNKETESLLVLPEFCSVVSTFRRSCKKRFFPWNRFQFHGNFREIDFAKIVVNFGNILKIFVYLLLPMNWFLHCLVFVYDWAFWFWQQPFPWLPWWVFCHLPLFSLQPKPDPLLDKSTQHI